MIFTIVIRSEILPWVGAPVGSNQRPYNWYLFLLFSAEHTTLRSKSKDSLVGSKSG